MSGENKTKSVNETAEKYNEALNFKIGLDKQLLSTDKKLIAGFINKISENLGDKVKEVRLFGSKARGEATEGSDIDLLIIVTSRGLWKPLHDLADEVEFDLDYPGYISLIVYHIDQWNELIKENTSFYREVQRDGKTLWLQ